MADHIPTIPGMSVHREIEQRIAVERIVARTEALEEAIALLRMAGFDTAATVLDTAAFGNEVAGQGSDAPHDR